MKHDTIPKPGADHKRMKRRWRRMTNAETRHRAKVKRLPCYGCGVAGINEAHHTLLRFPEKENRRDHRWLLPLCAECHRGRYGVHGIGNEVKWLERNGRTETEAIAYMAKLWEAHRA